MYTVSQEFPDSVKNMLLLKNPQFLPYHYEILTKEGTHEDLILTKFRNDQIKIASWTFLHIHTQVLKTRARNSNI